MNGKTLMWEIGDMVAKRLITLKGYTDSRINSLTINANQITGGVIAIERLPEGSVFQPGIIQLENQVSTSETTAITPGAILIAIEELRTELLERKIENAVLAPMNAMTLKGNNTNTAAAPKDLTVPEVQAMLGIVEASKFVEGDKNDLDTLVNWYVNFPNAEMGVGPKRATEAGKFGQMSLTDDYMYICVTEGAEGLAKWKKILLTQIA